MRIPRPILIGFAAFFVALLFLLFVLNQRHPIENFPGNSHVRCNFCNFFNLSDYEDATLDQIFTDYKYYHRGVTSGLLEPKFLMVRGLTEQGLGNSMEQIAFGFLVALLSGRALLLEFTTPYNITGKYFSPPGFDWSFHRHSKMKIFENTTSLFRVHLVSQYPQTSWTEAWEEEPIVEYIHQFKLGQEEYRKQFFNNTYLQDVVPSTLGNWKTNLLHFLFSQPSHKMQQRILQMKDRMSGYNGYISIQMRRFLGGNDKNPEWFWDRFFGCAEYWLLKFPNRAIFLATDDTETKEMAVKRFGSKLFTFHGEVKGIEANVSTDQQAQEDAVIDWFLIGDGELSIVTSVSTYGITACDRGNLHDFPYRFHIGGLTQCTNESAPYYVERIYYSPMEIKKQTGKLKIFIFDPLNF